MEENSTGKNLPAAIDWKEKCISILRSFSSENKAPKISESLTDLQKKKDSIENNLTLLLDEIKQRRKEIDDLHGSNEENFIQYKCQLYELITNIRWDLESDPCEVNGYVSKPLNVFNLNTETHSNYYISNLLWELISGEVETLSVTKSEVQQQRFQDEQFYFETSLHGPDRHPGCRIIDHNSTWIIHSVVREKLHLEK